MRLPALSMGNSGSPKLDAGRTATGVLPGQWQRLLSSLGRSIGGAIEPASTRSGGIEAAMDSECRLQTLIVICASSHLGYYGSACPSDLDPAGCRLALPGIGRAAPPRRRRSRPGSRDRRLVL